MNNAERQKTTSLNVDPETHEMAVDGLMDGRTEGRTRRDGRMDADGRRCTRTVHLKIAYKCILEKPALRLFPIIVRKAPEEKASHKRYMP